MNFLNRLKKTQNSKMNKSVTENGAVGYRTTSHNLLDMHFAVASLRKASEQEIINTFLKAYYDDKKLAIKWLFYVRDIRGGLGERRLFRTIFKYFAENNKEIPIKNFLNLFPEYGRFDDLLDLLETPYCDDVIDILSKQLTADLEAFKRNETVSLLAKWLPSINASSQKTKKRGRMIAAKMGMSEKEYRKTLSALRGHLDVVERKMSANQFEDIHYEAVPSKANLIYKEAFLHHDKKRRLEYLAKLQTGETTIHASVLCPHEIVHAYMSGFRLTPYDETLEQLWKSLDDATNGLENTIVVADGSGSMMVPIGNSSCTALSAANALAIYFAERCKGQFQNHYITFSSHPQLVDLSKGQSLREKLQITQAYQEVANTDIYKVFQLILHTAVEGKMKQSELPEKVVIISDMEFDSCAENANEPLFTQIENEYKNYGYKLPHLVFWNMNSRTGTIPIKENTLGVTLVSGFSVNILNMVLTNELSPYKSLQNLLDTERYEAVEQALCSPA